MAQKKVQTENKKVKDKEVVELEKKISSAKKNVSSLKKEVDSAKAEYDKTVATNAKRVKALKNSKSKIQKDIITDSEKIDRDLLELAKRQEEFQAEHDAAEADITNKIEELKQKRKALLIKDNEAETKTFLKKKADIEKQMNSLRDTKAKQAEVFEKKMIELKSAYDQLLDEKKNEIRNVKERIEAENAAAEKAARELQEKKEAQARLEQEEIERQRRQQEELMEKLNAEKQETISKLSSTLADVQSEETSLTSLRDSLITKLNTLKISSENEYNEMVIRYENENTRLINENNLKLNELQEAQAKLDSTIKKHRLDYENRTKELDTVNALLEERKHSKKQSVVKAIEDLDASLKSKHSDFLDYLDQQFETERKNRENDLKTLEYNLEQEEIQLKNRNSYLETRLSKKEEEFKSNLEENIAQLVNLNNSLVNDEAAHASRKNELENSLNKMKNDHYLYIEQKNKENLKAYQDRKAELSDKENKLVATIADIRANINEQNTAIEDLKKEIETVTSEFERKKSELTGKQEVFTKDSSDQREFLVAQIASITSKNEEENARHLTKMGELDEIENKKRSEYEEEVRQIEEEFASKKNALESKNEENVRQLNAQHESAIADIVAKYNANVTYIEGLYNQKRVEYENARATLDDYAAKLNQETEEKLKEFEAQRANILESMEQLKAEKTKDEEEYAANVAAVEDLYRRQIEEANSQHTERMNVLAKEYEEKNLEKTLEEVSSLLSAKQVENADLTSELERKTKQFGIDIESLNTQFNLKKQELSDDIAHLSESFEQSKAAAEKSETDAQNELSKRLSTIRDYQDEISEKIALIKAQKQEDLDNHIALLSEKEKQISEKLEEKRLNTLNSYDSKIETIRKQYELRSEQYNTLLADIAAKKESFIADQKNKYNQEIDYTNMMQERMNELVELNTQHRDELARKLDEKRSEIAANLDKLKGQLSETLEQKRASYKEYEANMTGKCDELRNDIARLENEARARKEEFEEYAAARRTEIDDLKDYNRNYLENLKFDLKELEDKRAQAEELHLARVNETKKQIASAMSEYDDLLRNSSTMIEEQTATFADLESATREFKQKFDDMEANYENIISALEEEKVAVLKEIADDINVLNEKMATEKEAHNTNIKEIYDSYVALIEKEKEKQKSIEEQLNIIRAQHDEEVEQIDEQSKGLPTEYETKVKGLMDEFNQKMKECSEQFKETSNSMKAEFEKMVAVRNKLSSRVTNVASAYEALDAQIENGKTNLQIVTRKLMNEILVDAERKAKSRARLNNLDAMSNKDN